MAILEDAGLETPLEPGVYESRLFEPKLTLALGEGWMRRDAITDRLLNLRRTTNNGDDLTFISGVDFLQCDRGEVVERPDAATIMAAIAASPMLEGRRLIEVAVGDGPAPAIVLDGRGEPIPEEEAENATEYGCVLSIGDAPFPQESQWVMATRDVRMLLIAVDVQGTTVLIRARPDDATVGPDTVYDVVLDLLAVSRLG